MRKLLLFAISLAAMASCSVYEYVPQTVTTTTAIHNLDYSESSARLLDGSSNFMVTPLIADLEVRATKITYVETEAFKDVLVTEQTLLNLPAYKRIALSHAIKAYNADILVGADIDVETSADYHFVITVTGYPAVYRNFRNATEADVQLVDDANEISGGATVTVVAPPTNTLGY